MRLVMKVAVAGWIGAALLVGGAVWSDAQERQKLENLRAECKRIKPMFGVDDPVCEAWELAKMDGLIGVQAELVRAERRYSPLLPQALLIGSAFGLLCSLPYLWYAFLRRVAELRRAINGEAPQ